MGFGANKLHPLQIEDAREAVFRASELQREVEEGLREASRNLAAAERAFRQKLSERMLELHAEGLAITTCETVAKGEVPVSDLRYRRDIAKGLFEAKRQESFRRGADRADANQLLKWSQMRDLRTDAEPADWSRREVVGAQAA